MKRRIYTELLQNEKVAKTDATIILKSKAVVMGDATIRGCDAVKCDLA